MFEFRWHVPGPSPSEVTLCLRSRSSWLGRKILTCGHETVYRRGWFAGIETRLTPPGGPTLQLRFAPVPGSADWQPVLLADGVEVPETTGTAPPRIVPPPKSLLIPVGLTYLIMAIVVAMLPQTSIILDAAYVRRDDRKAVLAVVDPAATTTLAVDTSQVVPAVARRPYSATLKAVGGTPPYTWAPLRDSWPRGWKLDATTGELSGTPVSAHDLVARVKVTDADKRSVEWPVVLVVARANPRGADWPAIATLTLPPATLAQPYEFRISCTGGQPPLTWATIGKRRLPDGLKLDPEQGEIRGTPAKAGQFPIIIRVEDNQYTAARDIARWAAPFVVTAVCLLGFLSMRRWSVYAFAVLIIGQAAGLFTATLPVSATALGLQTILWLVGLAHVGRMR